jgi:hypothetical protein
MAVEGALIAIIVLLVLAVLIWPRDDLPNGTAHLGHTPALRSAPRCDRGSNRPI